MRQRIYRRWLRRRRGRRKPDTNLALGIIVIVFAAAVLRFLYVIGIGSIIERKIFTCAESEVFVYAALTMEMERGTPKGAGAYIAETAFSQSAILSGEGQPSISGTAPALRKDYQHPSDFSYEIALPVLPGLPETKDTPGADHTQAAEEVAPEPEAATFQFDFSKEAAERMKINNATSYKPDIPALLAAPLSFEAHEDRPEVLIIHTHATEAFSGSSLGSDTARSDDPELSVIRLGAEIAGIFESKGIGVIHDTGIRDYPSYSTSYTSTLKEIEGYLEENPTIKIVIDVHRDYIEDDNGRIIKTHCLIDGQDSAQIMLVMGSNEGGLPNPDWQENLKFALKLQSAMDDMYPGLTRPLSLRSERFNMHATTGSILVEIGSSGNSLDEALLAAAGFAEAAGELINHLKG